MCVIKAQMAEMAKIINNIQQPTQSVATTATSTPSSDMRGKGRGRGKYSARGGQAGGRGRGRGSYSQVTSQEPFSQTQSNTLIN